MRWILPALLSAMSMSHAHAQTNGDAFFAHIQWCANPGAAESTNDATRYSSEMLEDLEWFGWIRVTPDNFNNEKLRLLGLMYAALDGKANAAENEKCRHDSVRFEVFEHGLEQTNIYYLLNETHPAAASFAVFDNDYAELGLRIACTSIFSEAGSVEFVSKLFGKQITWEELREIHLPQGTWNPQKFDISEAFRSEDPEEENATTIKIHPMRAGYKAEYPDDFIYAIQVQTRSALAPKVTP